MQDWHYGYAGLHIAAEMPLPELTAYEIEAANEGPDLWIRLGGADTPWWEAPVETRVTARCCEYSVGGVASYRVLDGNLIVVWPVIGAASEDVRLYMFGTAWAALLYQRDQLPLHAGVVRLGGEAVAFCGVPGMGKSTATAWLVEQGYQLLSDDLCRCTIEASGPPVVWRAARQLRLNEASLRLIGRTKDGLGNPQGPEPKFNLPWSGAIEGDSFPLRAIYVLEWGELQIVPITGKAAVERLIATGTYHPRLLEAMGQLPSQWQRCMALASRVSIWRFVRRRDEAAMEDAMQHLVRHLQSPG